MIWIRSTPCCLKAFNLRLSFHLINKRWLRHSNSLQLPNWSHQNLLKTNKVGGKRNMMEAWVQRQRVKIRRRIRNLKKKSQRKEKRGKNNKRMRRSRQLSFLLLLLKIILNIKLLELQRIYLRHYSLIGNQLTIRLLKKLKPTRKQKEDVLMNQSWIARPSKHRLKQTRLLLCSKRKYIPQSRDGMRETCNISSCLRRLRKDKKKVDNQMILNHNWHVYKRWMRS